MIAYAGFNFDKDRVFQIISNFMYITMCPSRDDLTLQGKCRNPQVNKYRYVRVTWADVILIRIQVLETAFRD